MATFSHHYPRAVHVLPLHALRGILQDGALLAKRDLAHRATAAMRATTSATDAVLGLNDCVHFYLLAQNSPWESVPILATQLLQGTEAPFPHVALEMATRGLADDDCTMCLWNIAVSRPRVPDVCKGGNWTRGTNPNRILEVWRAFRNTGPDLQTARGYWNDPIEVPTLQGSQILEGLRFFAKAASGIPELLLRAPVKVDRRFILWVFSEDDMTAVTTLKVERSSLPVRRCVMGGYESQATSTRQWRSQIVLYFAGHKPFPAGLDFDRKR